MNLGLIGDPYYVRMILRNAPYVYKKCSNIFIPNSLLVDKDCNSYSEVFSVENAIINQDVIDEMLTFYRGNAVPSSIQNILNRTSKIISIKNLDINNIPKSFQHKYYNPTLLKSRPSILSLSIGPASQQYHVEMLINKCLRDMNLNFYQSFSPESRYILMNQNFNGSCFTLIEKYRLNYDLFVGGLTVNGVNELLNTQSPICSLINKMSPDSIVISCNATQSYIANNIYPAIDILKYRYNIKQIVLVISEYYFNDALNISIKIPPQNKITYSNHFYITDFNKTTETKFINRLLSPVYLPVGIIPV